jgi:DNA-binding GntR family transcriptional regulator
VGTTAGKGSSRATLVGAQIRADILAGHFEPGSRLTFPELCKTYDVSVGVLREALTRLVDRGVVQATNNLGFRVMALSDSNFAGLAVVRGLVEPQFFRRAVDGSSVEWEANVLSAHHLLTRAPLQLPDGTVSLPWLEAHGAFHTALVSGADNYRMNDITARLRIEADLYARWWLTPDRLEEMSDRMAEEHAALLDAALDRDVDRCGTLLEAHIRDGSLAISARSEGAQP